MNLSNYPIDISEIFSQTYNEELSNEASSSVSVETKKEESETVVRVPERTDKPLWEHLKDCLPDMPRQSFFCFPGELKVERDLINELLKNPPADSLKDLCTVQMVNCKEDGEKMTLNGFERACLKQHCQWFEHL